MQSRQVLLLIITIFTNSAFGEESFENPVDGRKYNTDGEFKTYEPKNPRDINQEKITTKNVRLLTGEQELKDRIQIEDLAQFIKAAEKAAFISLAKNKAPALVLLQFNCQPNGHTVQIASQGDTQQAVLQELYDKTKTLAPLKTTGEVIFQVEFNVNN